MTIAQFVLGLAACTPADVPSVLDDGWSAGIRTVEVDVRLPHVCVAVTDWAERSGNSPVVVAKIKPAVDDATRLDRDGLARARAVGAVLHLEAALVKDPPSSALRDGSLLHLLRELRDETGAARVGFSTHELEVCATAPPAAQPNLDRPIAEVGLSALRPAPGRQALASLQRGGWCPWINHPLAFGALTSDRSFARLDPASAIEPDLVKPLQALAGSVASRLAALSTTPEELPPATAAVGFALVQPGVERVVVDPRDSRELNECLAARGLVSVDDSFRDAASRFGDRPAMPA